MQEQLIALLGHPVHHSKSPQMQNAAFQSLGLPYHYMAFDVLPSQLKEAVEGLRALGFHGANVTIPHKIPIIPFLDALTPLAKAIGAVNTLYFENDRLIGDNTDGQGYLASLSHEFPHVDPKMMTVGIVGAGGAARAIAFTLAQYGVRKLYITNRHDQKAEELVAGLQAWTAAEVVSMDTFQNVMPQLQLLIHSTPVGMSPNVDESVIPNAWLHSDLIVSDLIYNPNETKLLREAKERGASIHNGIGMLVHQGALSFERWTGRKAPIDFMKVELLNRLYT